MITFENEQERETFLKFCRSYIGVQFKHRGRSRHGLDCAGLPICALQQMGKKPFDIKVYGREPFRDGLREVTEKNLGEPVHISEMGKGDIVLIKFTNEPHHVAVVGNYIHGGFSLIHCYGEVGKVVEHRLDSAWLNRIKYVYKIRTKA